MIETIVHAIAEGSQKTMTRIAWCLFACSLLALVPRQASAVDGEITAKGGGVIKYTNAESVTTVPGTTDVLLKFLGEEGSFELPGMTKARLLAIGGGGGGGAEYRMGFTGSRGGGGGGGGGGYVETNDMFSAAVYTVNVGLGGKAGVMGMNLNTLFGGTGGDTMITTNGIALVTAFGGGGGGGECAGLNGGSGGGGSRHSSGAERFGGEPVDAAQGFKGGTGDAAQYGGGGGGAGGEGAAASTTGGGVGGIGRQSDITGELVYYAGGGGGGWSSSQTTVPTELASGIAGGLGGGGKGGAGRNKGINPEAGADGFGGGGGGANGNLTGVTGGAKGGSGVLYVRIAGSIAGGLVKPVDRSEVYDGGPKKVIEDDTNPFYTIDGENTVTEIGIHTVTVTPIEGVEWEGGGRETVTVSLTITEPGAFSGMAYVTGAPVTFAGVTGTNWINGELILKFTSAGSFSLPGTSQARILAVGGGGGGGAEYRMGFTGNRGGGAGGGAGGFIETTGQLGKETYLVSVGRGGAGGVMGMNLNTLNGSDGGDTTILTNGVAMFTAFGGGGGGGESVGRPGGSGGGGSRHSSGETRLGGEPVDAAQGFKGGTGDAAQYGGGGGGAGGAGAAASTVGGGVGGIGRQSDITGELVYYAGGGGGGWSSSQTTVPTELANGIAGGLGGGGKGGAGRNKGINPEAGADGFGGGGGGANGNLTGVTGGAKGGSGIVYVRISTAMEGDFKKPVSPAPIAYDRNAHTSVVTTAFYNVTGDNIGIDVGRYEATATLKEGISWPEGGNDPVTVVMEITNRLVTISGLHVDNWEYQTPVEETPDPTCEADPEWAQEVLVYDYAPAGSEEWQMDKPTEKGDYQVKVRLTHGAETNYKISNPEATVATFKITPILVVYDKLALRDWMYGTPEEETPNPSCTTNRSDVGAVFEYKNRNDERRGGLTEEEWKLAEEGWSVDKPTAVGQYWVRVRPPDFDNYTFEIKYAEFQIYPGFGDLFTDWVDITIAGQSGEAQTSCPYRLTLKDDVPVGFLHARAGVDGETLAFTDANGTTLGYKVVSWNADGVSTLVVVLPELTDKPQTIRLFWHLREDKKAPTHVCEPAEPTVTPSYTFGLVNRNGLFVNYWTEWPAMTAYEWESGKTPGTLKTKGKLAEGEVAMSVINSFTGEPRATIPTDEVGSFRLTFRPDDLRQIYEPISTNLDIRISGIIVIDNLRGSAGDETLNGRVMLANDDEAFGHKITGQGWWQTSVVDGVAYDTFWDHGTTTHEAPSADRYFPYVLYGINHTLNHVNEDETTNVLWRLKDVLMGNQALKTSSGGAVHLSRNYLPWSSTSLGISSKAEGTHSVTNIKEVGNLLLRNRVNAAVYSPCYSDGIGTIYFDVVNGQRDGGAESYEIVVEVATETASHEPPTDENSRAKIGDSVFPHLEEIGDAQWISQTIYPLKRDNNAATFTAENATQKLDLGITKVGTTNNFYRVYVPVNVRGAARFRIRRTTTVSSGEPSPYNDFGGFILLDNIVVSYPQMIAKAEAYGFMDRSRETTPRQILGQELATTVPFPASGQENVFARVNPIREGSGLTNINEKSLIQFVRMHCRWRYLDQKVSDKWTPIDISPANNFISDMPLTLPEKDGDLEFWFETETQVPYYEYYDYSGTHLGLANYYSEAVGTQTNRIVLSETDSLPSGGRDWFFRLRAGKSDYEGINLVVKDDDRIGIGDQTLTFDLVGDHVWRCLLKTPTNVNGSVKFRIEANNLQKAGSDVFDVNCARWKLAATSVEIGGVGTLEETDEEGWTSLVVDDKAGCAMFQIDDRPEVRSFVVVHGDRQDFNLWGDANKTTGGHFVGQFELGSEGASGTSDRTREFLADMTNWSASVSIDTNYWRETFTPMDPKDPTQLPIDEAFASTLTPNRWTAGPGQWAAGYYNDPATGRALQMEGRGYGYLQLTDSGKLPRGLKSISFTARLAQNHGFDDVCFWDDVNVTGGKSSFKNYTFVTKGSFDLNGAKDFSGAASVSALAYYRQGVGCYEFRITQKTAVFSGSQPKGPGSTRTLQLYRWTADAQGQMKATALGDAYDLTLSSMGQTEGEKTSDIFPMLFISCSNTTDNATIIYAGVSKTAYTPATTDMKESAWCIYTDKSNDRLISGTFGVASCGCPARFCYPFWYDKPVSGQTPPAANKLKTVESGTPKLEKGTRSDCASSIGNDQWAIAPDRYEYAEKTGTTTLRGFRARTIPQKVEVYTAPKGTANWGEKPIGSFDVSSFGSSGGSATNVINLYTTDDCSIRLAMGGTILDPRCDVVVDDVQIEQWRGESFDDTPHDLDYPSGQLAYGLPTNFVFTQAWILTNNAGQVSCQLNAKKSLKTVATSIRSPLMDGIEGRGLGLGIISFTYANAQANAKLLVQIATNEADITTLRDISKSTSASYWTTVTNVDFSAMSAAERAYGLKSFYIGLHGVKGIMRIALDPATVDKVKDIENPNLFGAVDILSVTCSDEPNLDGRSWWGWNLRTTDDTSMIYLGDQKITANPNGGLAFGLNNSVEDDVRTESGNAYRRHTPFLQTAQMSANLIGEISFKARKYDLKDAATYVDIYGSQGGRTPDGDWAKVATIEIKDDIYRTYTHKIPQGARYASLRLAVVGVEKVEPDELGRYMPESTPDQVKHPHPFRVLIDEVVISESIDARIAFRNVRPFRFTLDSSRAVTDIMSENEQPLVGESWGVQGEVFAAQLTEEIDLSSAKVRLSWFVGDEPWGFDQWKNDPAAQHAWLAESSDTERVFRSSYQTCPEAIVPLVDKATTVQYMLEVIWQTANGESTITNRMEASDWVKPEWYRGIDYNGTRGQSRADKFAGYTILDTVAPHWAWVNEANILGEYDDEAKNSDSDYQYVEIAAPAEADLSGWSIRMLEADTANQEVITNTVATFGGELDGLKKDLLGQASGMVFHVVGSLPTLKSGRISRSKGEIDGTWSFENPSVTFNADGEIMWTDAFGIQLVRPSGIVEHEIVLNGYNYWGAESRYDIYDPTNTVNFFNKRMPGSAFFYAGDDHHGQANALSVCDGHGETSNVWDNAMIHTPGRINTYADGTPQVLPADHPTPAGDTVIVHCNLGGDGRLVQTVGTAVESELDQIIVLKKGSATGTNITYTAAPWYELGLVTTNGAAMPLSARKSLGGTRWQVTVGVGVSNGFTVVANAGVCEKLRDLGVTDDNRYKNAIMDWFEKGVDLYGNPWPESDGEVYPVAFRDLGFNFVTNLSVTECYWLDICPTITNQHLVGGMSEAPEPISVAVAETPRRMMRMATTDVGTEWPGLQSITNCKMSVFLMVTNANPIGSADWRAPYAPYVLRGMQPGYTSWDYATNKTSSVWTNGTFKIAGILMNGLTSKENPQNWVPLRWFVFTEDSFFKPGCVAPHKPYTSEIEMPDPSVHDSPAYDAWGDWVEKNCGGIWPKVFYRWELNERQRMYDIEVLKKTNYLSE